MLGFRSLGSIQSKWLRRSIACVVFLPALAIGCGGGGSKTNSGTPDSGGTAVGIPDGGDAATPAPTNQLVLQWPDGYEDGKLPLKTFLQLHTYKITTGAETEKIANPQCAWTSGNPAVATVDEHGVVTAVAKGTSEITATLGGLSAKKTVTVLEDDPDTVVINADAYELAVGIEAECWVLGDYKGRRYPMQEQTITVNPATAATVSRGSIMPRVPEPVTLTATVAGYDSPTLALTFTAARAVAVEMSERTTVVGGNLGDKGRDLVLGDGTEQEDFTGVVISSAPAVVSIDGGDELAIGAGEATITVTSTQLATDGGTGADGGALSAMPAVTVSASEPFSVLGADRCTGIAFADPAPAIPLGLATDLHPSCLLADGRTIGLDPSQVVFSVGAARALSADGVVHVSQGRGRLTALAPGDTTVTASLVGSNLSASVPVRVLAGTFAAPTVLVPQPVIIGGLWELLRAASTFTVTGPDGEDIPVDVTGFGEWSIAPASTALATIESGMVEVGGRMIARPGRLRTRGTGRVVVNFVLPGQAPATANVDVVNGEIVGLSIQLAGTDSTDAGALPWVLPAEGEFPLAIFANLSLDGGAAVNNVDVTNQAAILAGANLFAGGGLPPLPPGAVIADIDHVGAPGVLEVIAPALSADAGADASAPMPIVAAMARPQGGAPITATATPLVGPANLGAGIQFGVLQNRVTDPDAIRNAVTWGLTPITCTSKKAGQVVAYVRMAARLTTPTRNFQLPLNRFIWTVQSPVTPAVVLAVDEMQPSVFVRCPAALKGKTITVTAEIPRPAGNLKASVDVTVN